MRGSSLTILLVIVNSVSSFRRVCYYTNWSQSRPVGGQFTPEDIDPYLCTHIIFAHARILGDKILPTEWNDESSQYAVGQYEKLTELKFVNPDLKVILGVNGWNTASLLADQPDAEDFRLNFVQSVIDFLRKRSFDGLDLNWALPTARRLRPVRREIFSNLLQDLRDGFEEEAKATGNDRLFLTAAVSAGRTEIDNRYEVQKLTRLLDFINVMTFDFHGPWQSSLEHHSSLYPRSSQKGDEQYKNVDEAMSRWLEHGAQKDKLLVGIPFYGRSFTTLFADQTDMGDPDTGLGPAGIYTQESGLLSYFEICGLLNDGAVQKWHHEHKVPYLINGTTWVAYDDTKSIKEKTKWLKGKQFGGAVIWAVDLDDFSGQFCNNGPYPLLRAAYDQLKNNHDSKLITESEKRDTLLSSHQSVADSKRQVSGQDQSLSAGPKLDSAQANKGPGQMRPTKVYSEKTNKESLPLNHNRMNTLKESNLLNSIHTLSNPLLNDELLKPLDKFQPKNSKMTGIDEVDQSLRDRATNKRNPIGPFVSGVKLDIEQPVNDKKYNKQEAKRERKVLAKVPTNKSTMMKNAQELKIKRNKNNSNQNPDTNNKNIKSSAGTKTNSLNPQTVGTEEKTQQKISMLNTDIGFPANNDNSVLDGSLASDMSLAGKHIYDISPTIRGVQPKKMSSDERRAYIKAVQNKGESLVDRPINPLPVELQFHKTDSKFDGRRKNLLLQEFVSGSNIKKAPIKLETKSIRDNQASKQNVELSRFNIEDNDSNSGKLPMERIHRRPATKSFFNINKPANTDSLVVQNTNANPDIQGINSLSVFDTQRKAASSEVRKASTESVGREVNSLLNSGMTGNNVKEYKKKASTKSASNPTNKKTPSRKRKTFTINAFMNRNRYRDRSAEKMDMLFSDVGVPYSQLCKYYSVLCFDHINKVIIHGKNWKTLEGVWDKPDNVTTTPDPREIILHKSNQI